MIHIESKHEVPESIRIMVTAATQRFVDLVTRAKCNVCKRGMNPYAVTLERTPLAHLYKVQWPPPDDYDPYISSDELITGAAEAKFIQMAELVAAQLPERFTTFYGATLPGGLNISLFAWCDDTMGRLRFLRSYDITKNLFVTRVDCGVK